MIVQGFTTRRHSGVSAPRIKASRMVRNTVIPIARRRQNRKAGWRIHQSVATNVHSIATTGSRKSRSGYFGERSLGNGRKTTEGRFTSSANAANAFEFANVARIWFAFATPGSKNH